MSSPETFNLNANVPSENAPLVFISYSHDSQEHKLWVLALASELRTKGIDVTVDAWDLRPGDDVPKFMEKGVRNANRVLMICTERYVAKANDGLGGVGYEAMIVTGELVRDLGTAKFIPIVRQTGNPHHIPTSVSTRRYINLSEGANREAEMDTLLRELHNIPSSKPPLGASPFARPEAVAIDAVKVDAATLHSGEKSITDATSDPLLAYERALSAAKSDDILKWRGLVRIGRDAIDPQLRRWWTRYSTTVPPGLETLIEQSMEGATAFAPLTAVALAGISSANPKYRDQIGLLEDILNPTEWQRGGFVVRMWAWMILGLGVELWGWRCRGFLGTIWEKRNTGERGLIPLRGWSSKSIVSERCIWRGM